MNVMIPWEMSAYVRMLLVDRFGLHRERLHRHMAVSRTPNPYHF